MQKSESLEENIAKEKKEKMRQSSPSSRLSAAAFSSKIVQEVNDRINAVEVYRENGKLILMSSRFPETLNVLIWRRCFVDNCMEM